VLMMMPFNCSFRNKNEPTAIYTSLGYSTCMRVSMHVFVYFIYFHLFIYLFMVYYPLKLSLIA
jgi:hypothetical protein